MFNFKKWTAFLIVIISCFFMGKFSFAQTEEISEEVKTLRLKLPFESGNLWTISCGFDGAYGIDQNYDAKCGETHGSTSINRYALDFNFYKSTNDCGEPILAIADGEVHDIEYNSGYGHYVDIKHEIDDSVYISRYAHLSARTELDEDESVDQGERIGTCGSTGNSTGCHLHFALYEELEKTVEENGKEITIKVLEARKPEPMDQYEEMRSAYIYLSSNHQPGTDFPPEHHSLYLDWLDMKLWDPRRMSDEHIAMLSNSGIGGIAPDDWVDPTASGDLESLFKYIKVSDAGKDMWEESVELEPGEKYDVKAKFHTYTGSTEIEGDIKFYLSDDKHFDTDEDEYLGKDTFTLRPGEDEKEYWRGEHAPDEEGNYYIFCRVKWDDDNRFYSEEYAKIKVRIPNYKPEGYLDSVSCDMIAGWARDSNTTDPISVHVYADGPAESGFFVGSTVANSYRGDLPYADKNHGFSFAIPNSLKDNQIHSLYVYAIDSEGGENPLLNNCPQNLQCVPIAAIMSIINGLILAEYPVDPDPTGDLNGDGLVTLSDAILALKVSCGMSFSVKVEADVNNDGKIGMAEVVYILKHIDKK